MDKQEKYELTITANSVVSTDSRFTITNLNLGDKYKPLDVRFVKADGMEIRRKKNKGEKTITNQTLPRLAFQIYEKQIATLSVEERKSFPICRYTVDSKIICGIFLSEEEFKKYKNSIENVTYSYGDGRRFVIYCWNIFSTIIFVQECLKRFGEEGDRFILTYRDKTEMEDKSKDTEEITTGDGYNNPYSQVLIESKNIIFRGAPGTGKSYLAKEIAADIVSNGYYDKYELLSSEQKKQVEFVQFHPSYDYSDFVEGLRPRVNDDGSMGFDRKDGVFKAFVDRARTNFENAHKSKEIILKEESAQEALDKFLLGIDSGDIINEFQTAKIKTKFSIADYDYDKNVIHLYAQENNKVPNIYIKISKLLDLLKSEIEFTEVKSIRDYFNNSQRQENSYYFILYKTIKEKMNNTHKSVIETEKEKKYIFIIDEINRGEISKIFGELFFSIDPGYRGESGAVSTQYANMHDDPDKKFYIPDNVYIIGTMNDIDRSVDTFDFAMRRRFRFIELKADDRVDMLDDLRDDVLKDEAIARMSNLNKAIAETEDLNENYQIGASYFLKLKKLSFEQLWTDYLEPLLLDYVQGMYNEKEIMKKFKAAYNNTNADAGNDDEDQG
ncbi:MAG: AAA family ATPase [Ruminococcus sp.]|uniref:McrB family protein n=1 Tax=Ruminococcus sp. TaxID=41978 RepID=UPI0025F24857|nr:AAA family ATPase [Ruminococcus sp.]MBO4867449.1 AAA family ATPase [Ruminococcus sp.]